MQDDAPPHTSTAIKTKKLCSENLNSFWNKKQWPGNPPDLNTIENLWSILKARLEESEPEDSNETLSKTRVIRDCAGSFGKDSEWDAR